MNWNKSLTARRSRFGRRHIEPHRGTAAVEFAVVLPVLMLIVLGCVDFGRVAFVSIALNNAVGAGVAYGSTHRFTAFTLPTWQLRVHEAVREEMQQIVDFDPGSLAVDVDTVSESDESVRVTVAATYPFETIVAWPGLPGSLVLRQQVVGKQYR